MASVAATTTATAATAVGVGGVGGVPENASKFLETLQSDLKVLASETKKKYPQIKEVRNRVTASLKPRLSSVYSSKQRSM